MGVTLVYGDGIAGLETLESNNTFSNRQAEGRSDGILAIEIDGPWGKNWHQKRHHKSQHWDKKPWGIDEEWTRIAAAVHGLKCPVILVFFKSPSCLVTADWCQSAIIHQYPLIGGNQQSSLILCFDIRNQWL